MRRVFIGWCIVFCLFRNRDTKRDDFVFCTNNLASLAMDGAYTVFSSVQGGCVDYRTCRTDHMSALCHVTCLCRKQW